MIAYLHHDDLDAPLPLPVHAGDIGMGLCVHRDPWRPRRWAVSCVVTGYRVVAAGGRRETVSRCWNKLIVEAANAQCQTIASLLAKRRKKIGRLLVPNDERPPQEYRHEQHPRSSRRTRTGAHSGGRG
jgi:hypothetical protein